MPSNSIPFLLNQLQIDFNSIQGCDPLITKEAMEAINKIVQEHVDNNSQPYRPKFLFCQQMLQMLHQHIQHQILQDREAAENILTAFVRLHPAPRPMGSFSETLYVAAAIGGVLALTLSPLAFALHCVGIPTILIVFTVIVLAIALTIELPMVLHKAIQEREQNNFDKHFCVESVQSVMHTTWQRCGFFQPVNAVVLVAEEMKAVNTKTSA